MAETGNARELRWGCQFQNIDSLIVSIWSRYKSGLRAAKQKGCKAALEKTAGAGPLLRCSATQAVALATHVITQLADDGKRCKRQGHDQQFHLFFPSFVDVLVILGLLPVNARVNPMHCMHGTMRYREVCHGASAVSPRAGHGWGRAMWFDANA